MSGKSKNCHTIDAIEVAAFRIPTESSESDGTLAWDHTTLVLVEIHSGSHHGIGYTYADRATAVVIKDLLAPRLLHADSFAISRHWSDMMAAVRNLGQCGICAMAISAVDVALWDLKAKMLAVPLAVLLGQCRDGIEIYGSGGFTSYDENRLCQQLCGWTASGIRKVKMKIGRDAAADLRRVTVVRKAIGPDPELFVDANGAYTRKQALAQAQTMSESRVTWFEEPVSSNDLEGLNLLRNRAPAGMQIAAGEYGYRTQYFQQMLAAQAVDVLQADASRCGGITGFLQVAALCQAYGIKLSAHCAPLLHLAVCCSATAVCHMEYFFDHVRIEQLLFDEVPQPREAMLHPNLSRPGLGVEFKRQDAARWALAV